MLTETEVMDLINSLPSGVATGLDHISSKLLKLIAPAIAPSLAKVLNCSIKNEIYPAQLKLARACDTNIQTREKGRCCQL